jgi:hypothetical protein
VEVESLLTDFDRELLWKSTKMRFSRWLVDRDFLDIATVLKVILQCEPTHWKLGDLAVRHNQISPDQVSEILMDQKKNGERFGQTAIRLGFLNSDVVAELLALQREDPAVLAENLVSLGLIERDSADTLLQEYINEMDIFSKASSLSAPSPSPQHA